MKKALNPNSFESIVSRFMSVLAQVEQDMIEDGIEIQSSFSRWALEQAITNRNPEKTMMEAAEDWMQDCEQQHMHS